MSSQGALGDAWTRWRNGWQGFRAQRRAVRPVLEPSHRTCLGPETGGGRLIPVFLKEEAFAQEGSPWGFSGVGGWARNLHQGFAGCCEQALSDLA